VATLKGKEKLIKQLQAILGRLTKGEETPKVVIGYSAWYAIFVHERLDLVHPVGQAKFLEQPFRVLRLTLYQMIVAGVKKGLGIAQSMLLAGMRLQAESQKLCPVKTGNLRASAFTRLVRK